MWSRPTTAILLGSLVALAAGCGGQGGDDQSARAVRASYADLQERFAARDGAGVCRMISRAAQLQVGSLGHATPTTCVRDIQGLFDWMGAAGRDRRALPTVRAVDVDGDRATVIARLDGGAPGRVRFVEERGGWKLDDFFGVTAPPPPDMR